MSDFVGIQLLDPAWLLLLPVVWLVLWLYVRYSREDSMWRRVCDQHLLDALMPQSGASVRRYVHFGLLAAVFTVGIVALAGPSWEKREVPLLESVAARVIVLDLSLSMLIEDTKPDRLTQAGELVDALINSQFDGETGLVVFAGAAFVVSPLTRDANTLKGFLPALHPFTMPVDGERLDLALDRAGKLLAASITGAGQIIVFTDGIHDLEATLEVVGELRLAGNRISVVALGTAEGGPLKGEEGGLMRDPGGDFVMARTDFDQLESISREGQGDFLRAHRGDVRMPQFVDAANSAQIAPSRNLEGEVVEELVNGGIWLVWLLLPLALLLFRKNTIWAIAVLTWLPAGNEPFADEGSPFWYNAEQRALQAYRSGEFERARELSAKQMLVGAALFKQADLDGALTEFSTGDDATALYNQGNVLAHMMAFDDAIDAYESALEVDTEHADARYNLALIESFLSSRAAAQDGSEGG